jgi:hypothetical protein
MENRSQPKKRTPITGTRLARISEMRGYFFIS